MQQRYHATRPFNSNTVYRAAKRRKPLAREHRSCRAGKDTTFSAAHSGAQRARSTTSSSVRRPYLPDDSPACPHRDRSLCDLNQPVEQHASQSRPRVIRPRSGFGRSLGTVNMVMRPIARPRVPPERKALTLRYLRCRSATPEAVRMQRIENPVKDVTPSHARCGTEVAPPLTQVLYAETVPSVRTKWKVHMELILSSHFAHQPPLEERKTSCVADRGRVQPRQACAARPSHRPRTRSPAQQSAVAPPEHRYS